MAPRRDPSELASDAWGWLKDAEAVYRHADDGSPEQLQAIQAMAAAAVAALTAEQAAG